MEALSSLRSRTCSLRVGMRCAHGTLTEAREAMGLTYFRDATTVSVGE